MSSLDQASLEHESASADAPSHTVVNWPLGLPLKRSALQGIWEESKKRQCTCAGVLSFSHFSFVVSPLSCSLTFVKIL